MQNQTSQAGTNPKPGAPRVSIVVPCYNEEEVLPETTQRLLQLLDSLRTSGKVRTDSCIVLVDDGSADRTWQLIQSASAANPSLKGLKLSRNRGHQHALLAGLHLAPGDAIISVDADLQDDLDVIPQMIDQFVAGCEIVYGVRDDRASDTPLKRWTAETYYRVLAKFGVEVVFNHADYRLLGRRAVAALREFNEVNLFLRGIIPLLGFKSGTVLYSRAERFAGTSKYSVPKMLALAVNGVTAFSATPLRAITVLGLVVSFLSITIAGWALWIRLATDHTVPGWTSIVVPLLLLGGVQLLALGVIGEYVAKTYLETKRRPPYIIDEIAGDLAATPASEDCTPLLPSESEVTSLRAENERLKQLVAELTPTRRAG